MCGWVGGKEGEKNEERGRVGGDRKEEGGKEGEGEDRATKEGKRGREGGRAESLYVEYTMILEILMTYFMCSLSISVFY